MSKKETSSEGASPRRQRGGFQPPDEPRGEIQIGNAAVAAFFLVLFAIGFAVSIVSTGITKIEPGQVGVVINNVTGKISERTQPGLVIHMPFGLTDVHLLDRSVRSFDMAGSSGSGAEERKVKVKSNDGSDVFVDATVTYTLDPNRSGEIARAVGVKMEKYTEILTSYTRSIIRDELGRLSIEQVIDAGALNEARAKLENATAEKAEPFGIEVNTIAAQNPSFNQQYERLISQRKETDQEFANQESAQERARTDQKRQIAEAQRERDVKIREVEGQQTRRTIEAAAEASERVRRAGGETAKITEEGEQALAVALAEADAIREEGLKKAEGIGKLAEAYRSGGLGLVREALAAKYAGQRINGRPYSLDSRVERLRVEREEGSPIEASKKKAAAAEAVR